MPIVFTGVVLLGLTFWQPSDGIMLPEASEATYPLLRSFKTAPRPPSAMFFTHGVLKSWHRLPGRPVSPCPCAVAALAQCYPYCPSLIPLEMNYGCQFPVQSDFQRCAGEHFIEVGKLESVSISLAPRFYYFLWSEFSNTPDKSLLKWKYENACKNQKEVFWLLPFCIPPALACLSSIC